MIMSTKIETFTLAERPVLSYGGNIESSDGINWSIVEKTATRKFVARVNFNGTMCTRILIDGVDHSLNDLI